MFDATEVKKLPELKELSDIKAIYSDYRFDGENVKLTGAALNRFTEILDGLSSLKANAENAIDTKISPWELRGRFLEQFYKLCFYQTFTDMGIKRPEGMELYFTGSLAKRQGTQYSDLDVFVLFEASGQKNDPQIKSIFESLNHLCMRVFVKINELYPDPSGINPQYLSGTPDEVFNYLLDENECIQPEAVVPAILSARPILGKCNLGQDLAKKIRSKGTLSRYCSVDSLCRLALAEFGPPKIE